MSSIIIRIFSLQIQQRIIKSNLQDLDGIRHLNEFKDFPEEMIIPFNFIYTHLNEKKAANLECDNHETNIIQAIKRVDKSC